MSRFYQDWGIDPNQAGDALDKVSLSSAEEKEAFLYGKLAFMGLITTDHPRDWYNASFASSIHHMLVNQYGALDTLIPAFYGPRTTCAPFMEVMKTVSSFTDQDKIAAGRDLLKSMNPMDWGALESIRKIAMQVTPEEVRAHRDKRPQASVDSDETI